MTIWLRWRGPMEGLEISGELQGSRLSPDLRERLQRAVDEGHLQGAGLDHPRADAEQFDLRIEREGHPPVTAVLNEEAIEPDLLELLRDLMQEVVRVRLQGEGE